MTRGRSLVARLTAVQVAVLGALWLVVIALTVVSTYQRGEGDIDSELRALANSLARLTAAVPPAAAQRIGDDLMAAQLETADPPLRAGELAYRVTSIEGRLLASSHERPAMPAGLAPSAWFTQATWDGEHTRYAVVGKHQDYYARRVRSTALQLVLMWVVLAGLSAIAFFWSFRRVIRPVRELAARVAARSSDDLSPVDEAGAFNELAPLLAALNAKLARIHALLEGERRFFADAAHELRTPLAALGAQAHVLAHTADAAERMAALRIIEGGIERSARVIAKLLTLGKLEGSGVRLQKQPADVAAIARAVVEVHRAAAARCGQQLEFDASTPAECACDADQIGVLIENLVDNAIRYCPEGSAIRVGVRSDRDDVLIRVADDGPGIAAADRERAFERFERLDAADGVGSGLGLAIVRRISNLHDGTALIKTGADGRGTVIEVRIKRLAGAGTAC